MATVSRRLFKKSKENKWHLIFVVTSGRANRWDISSRVKLKKEFWTSTNRVSGKLKESGKLNFFLDYAETALKAKTFEILGTGGGKAESEQIQLILNHLILELQLPAYDDNIQPKSEFFPFVETFISEAQASKAIGTIKTYRQTLNRLKEFNPELSFDDIDLKFYHDFIAYLTEAGINNNTAGKHVKNLKTFLNEATERGINANLEFRKKRFKVFKEEVDNVYLSKDEIAVLTGFRYKLSDAKRKVLDLFLIGCHTGLRFSDISNLSTANLLSENTRTFLLQRTKKTGQNVVIPLNSEAMALLNEYGGNIPKAISNQKTNKALKEICKQAGLVKEIEIKTRIGGETNTQVWKKYELVSTHTARRSFATNAFLAGVPVLSIMKFTGHKSERSFMQYIKATQLENAQVLSDHPFFK